jgi:hypothetical protein
MSPPIITNNGSGMSHFLDAPRWCFCREVKEEIHRAATMQHRRRRYPENGRHDPSQTQQRLRRRQPQLRIMACVVDIVKTPLVQLEIKNNSDDDEEEDGTLEQQQHEQQNHHHEYTLVLDDGTGDLVHCEIPPHMLQTSNETAVVAVTTGVMVDVVINIIILDATTTMPSSTWLTIDTLIIAQRNSNDQQQPKLDDGDAAFALRTLQLIYNRSLSPSSSSSSLAKNHDPPSSNESGASSSTTTSSSSSLLLGYPSMVITSRTIYEIIQSEATEGISLDDLCLCLLLDEDKTSKQQQQPRPLQQLPFSVPVVNNTASRTPATATTCAITTRRHVQDAIMELQSTGQIYQNQQGSYQPL